MINKIMPRITTNTICNRKILKTGTTATLLVLAGSSMSNWSGPRFVPTDMIIPGGLDFKEKAYFLLKGKLPKSVYERWVPVNNNYHIGENDQIVKINIAEGRYIGNIIENPHDIDSNLAETLNPVEGLTVDDITTTTVGIDGDPDSDDDLSAFEIWKHLAGFSD